MNRLLLGLMGLIGLFIQANAQISYQVSYQASIGNPSSLNQESDNAWDGWVSILNGGLLSNQWSSNKSLPFSFSCFGQSFSSYKVSANGLLTFTTSASQLPNDNQSIPTSALPNYTIAAYWEKFTNFAPTGTNDQVMIKTFGQAPNRQFWVRWTSFEWGPTSFATLAIVLEESTNKIYIVDMYNSLTAGWVTATVGVQENSQFGVQTGDNNITLDGRTANFTDNSYYTFEPYVIPPEDLQPVRFLSPLSSGCGLGEETVSVRVVNLGQLPATQGTVSYQLDGGAIQQTDVNGAINPGDTVTVTFHQKADLRAPGTHTLRVWTDGPNDENPTNDTLTRQFNTIQEIATFPYHEDFEQGPGDWESSGTNNTWEWATPVGPTILGATSGLKTWVTNADGSYAAFEDSYLVSPCFNFTDAGNDVWVSFQIWWETDAPWDGLSFQGSTDAGNSWELIGSFTDDQWYNANFIASLPGGTGAGWSGSQAQNSSSEGWRKVYLALPAKFLNRSGIRFRFAFGSNGATQKDGVAIDDIAIGTPPVFSLGASGFYCAGDTLQVSHTNVNYLWSNGSTASAITLNPLDGQPILDSTISLTLTDDIGLVRTHSIQVNVDLPLTLSLVDMTHVGCAGDATGEISIQRSGGSAVAVFNWNDGSINQNLLTAPAGTYQVIATDANGCTDTLSSLVILENDSVKFSAQTKDVSCAGLTDGEISLAPQGGKAPYDIQWSQGDSGPTVDALAAGTYTATLTDSIGCVADTIITVIAPDSLSVGDVLVNDATCFNSQDGQVNLDLQGGTAPFTFTWTDTLGRTSPDTLWPGTYQVSVVDSNGCVLQDSGYVVSYRDTLPKAGFEVVVVDPWIELIDTSAGAATYLWDFGDGDTSTAGPVVRHSYPENGTYIITQTVQNSCGSASVTDTLNILRVNLDPEVLAKHWSVYPLPAHETLTLTYQGSVLPALIVNIQDVRGRVWLSQSFAHVVPHLPLTLAVGQLPAGMYILSGISPQGVFRKKILIE